MKELQHLLKTEQKCEYDTEQLQISCAAADLHWHSTEGPKEQSGLKWKNTLMHVKSL